MRWSRLSLPFGIPRVKFTELMKTYSQTQNKRPFNWIKALSNPLSEKQWKNLEEKASSWVTCACGNQCAIIPRNNGEPLDKQLSRLGFSFYLSIAQKERKEAIYILEQIEKRSGILIKEILKNKS